MILELKGLTRDEELRWLLALPWTVASAPADDPDEYVIRVAEMPDAIVVGTHSEVVDAFWDSLRASLDCRLDAGDPIPLPRSHVIPAQPVIHLVNGDPIRRASVTTSDDDEKESND